MWSDNTWSTTTTKMSRPNVVEMGCTKNVGNQDNDENTWKPLEQNEGTSIGSLKATPLSMKVLRKSRRKENDRPTRPEYNLPTPGCSTTSSVPTGNTLKFATDLRKSTKKKIRVIKNRVFHAREKIGKSEANNRLLHTTPRNKRLQWRQYQHQGLFASPYSPYASPSGVVNALNKREVYAHNTQMYSPFDIITPNSCRTDRILGCTKSAAVATPKRPVKRHKNVLYERVTKNIIQDGLQDLEELAAKFDMKISSPVTRSMAQNMRQVLSPVQTRRQQGLSPQVGAIQSGAAVRAERFTTLPTSCIIWGEQEERLV